MRLLEFEAKEILKKYGVEVPAGQVVTTLDGFNFATPVMLKAQVPIGGRGKADGVIAASSTKQCQAGIKHLLGKKIRGFHVIKLLVEEKLDIDREFFMAVTYDTVAKAPIAIFSPQGGVDIEILAARDPGRVRYETFSARNRLPHYRAREIISDTGVTGRRLLALAAILAKLADIFLDYDATVAEINPLALTREGQLVALDCHLEIDDDALFRHRDLSEIAKDKNRIQPERTASDFESEAAKIDNLDHRGVAGRVIEFDGTMGLIIGGGGASLTAFDAVKAHGGKPANYCEIGGNPSVLKVKELTKLILSKPGVEKIAVIMNVVSNTRVDLVARGIIKGVLESGKDPATTVAVFRVPGAWEEEGFKILSKYGVRFGDRTCSIDQAARLAAESFSKQDPN
jgi:succinyl-CoA synthetase beta subunit/citryl-CoA synthetase large subunit